MKAAFSSGAASAPTVAVPAFLSMCGLWETGLNSAINRQWLLARRPAGDVGIDDFRYNEAAIPEPADGEVLVRVLYFAYDASQRIWLTEHGGYLPPIQVGEPMRTMGLGQVVKSRNPAYAGRRFRRGLQ